VCVMNVAEKKRCFVIMPFSKTSEEHDETYWTNHFNCFLKPLIEENTQLKAERSEPLRGDMLKQIITNLVTCPIVVADLTDRNPNVYWELGVRQSFKHGTVTIARGDRKGDTDLPFDISVKGVLFYYPTNHVKMAEFCKKFKRAISDCISNPSNPDSHVLECISGRGTLFEIFRRDETRRRLEALYSECQCNITVFKSICEAFEKKHRLFTGRLRMSSIELLVTSRYLEADEKFYNEAEEYLSIIISANQNIQLWMSSPEEVEKLILKYKKDTLTVFENFSKKIKAVKQDTSKLC
jgi:hypothetical protein